MLQKIVSEVCDNAEAAAQIAVAAKEQQSAVLEISQSLEAIFDLSQSVEGEVFDSNQTAETLEKDTRELSELLSRFTIKER